MIIIYFGYICAAPNKLQNKHYHILFHLLNYFFQNDTTAPIKLLSQKV